MAVLTKSAKLEALDVAHVQEYLTTYPDVINKGDGTRAYEEAIVRLIDQNPWKYEDVQAVMTQLIDEYESQPDMAYAAYYALCTYYRRNSLKTDYNTLINAPRPGFTKKVSYGFLLLMCKKILDPNDWSLLEEADRLCDPEIMGYNYGVEHCFAEYVAEACEKDHSRAAYFVSEYMQKALDRVNDALKISNGYAKFYVTRARLHNIKAIYADIEKREPYFKQAQNDVELAISRETDKNKQIDYQLIGVRMQSEYYEQVLSKTIMHQEEMINKQIQENNVKNLEFLSFFSAIIGLLIAGTQIMMGMKFAEGATLLVALTGCLITAFGTIGYVLHGGKKRLVVNTIIVILGIALIVGAMLYGGRYAM